MGSFADVRFSRLGILRKTEMNCSRAFFLCESPKFLLLFSTFLFPFFFFFFFSLVLNPIFPFFSFIRHSYYSSLNLRVGSSKLYDGIIDPWTFN